ncbi:MAG: transcriptional repressor NrdR [Phycisphaerales bacterium]|nr:transcriptional repressor NrdR [Phycisphaerales bacterium]
MICPYCEHNDDKVIDSRASDGGKVVRRRRECLKCHKRFTTYERVEESARLVVLKKDGTHVSFNRENVLRGLNAACGKRPVSEEAKHRIVDEVEEELHREYEREVPSRVIGEKVMARLRHLDEVAYVRYASEYYQFQNVGQFVEELKGLDGRIRDVKDQQQLFNQGAPRLATQSGGRGGDGRE